jgi:hypothetical protein
MAPSLISQEVYDIFMTMESTAAALMAAEHSARDNYELGHVPAVRTAGT